MKQLVHFHSFWKISAFFDWPENWNYPLLYLVVFWENLNQQVSTGGLFNWKIVVFSVRRNPDGLTTKLLLVSTDRRETFTSGGSSSGKVINLFLCASVLFQEKQLLLMITDIGFQILISPTLPVGYFSSRYKATALCLKRTMGINQWFCSSRQIPGMRLRKFAKFWLYELLVLLLGFCFSTLFCTAVCVIVQTEEFSATVEKFQFLKLQGCLGVPERPYGPW